MPGIVWLINRDSGQPEPIAPEQVATALATGKYLDPEAVAVHQNGLDTYVAPEVARQEQAFTPAIDPAVAARAAGHTLREQENTGIGAGAKAALGGTVSGLSFGLLDPFQEEQEFNRIASVGGQIVGALAPALVGDEAGLLGLGRLGRGAVVAEDALTAERATAALSSRALFGGRAAEGASELEQGLGRANAALRSGSDAAHAADAAASAGLEGLDAKGLRAAHEAELEAIKAGRIPQRAQLADEIAAFRQQARDDKLWLTTKKTEAAGETAGGPPTSPPTPAREITSEQEFHALQDAFRAKLTDQEIKQSIRFSREYYIDVNRHLRGVEGYAKLPESEATIIPTLDAALEKGRITEPLVTHRGAYFDPGEVGHDLKPGDVFSDPGYLSTTYRPEKIERFGNVHFVITSPAGTKIAAIPSSAAEGEFLLARGSKLRVTAREELGGGRVRLHATVEPTGVVPGGKAPATWREFQAAKMAEYMASEGGHAGAMKRLAKEWAEIKAGGAAAPSAAAATPLSAAEFDAIAGQAGQTLDPAAAAALNGYSRNGLYGVVNSSLNEFHANPRLVKKFNGDPLARMTPEQADTVRAIDRGFVESAAPRDLVAYRGVNGEASTRAGKTDLAALKPGDTFVNHGYTSATADPAVAESYAKGMGTRAGVEMQIEVPAGHPVVPVPSEFSAERELLLPRDSKYTVVSTEKGANGRTILRVRVGEAPIPELPKVPALPKIEGLTVLGKRTLKADRLLDRLLDNPKAFAARPERALDALQQQESALEGILAKREALRARFAADTSGERLAALDKIPAALDRNRALQTRIAELTAEPTSARLRAIADAKDMLAAGGAAKSLPEQMLGGAVFSGVAGLTHALPGIGSMLAPLAGAKASKLVTDLVFGKLGKTTAAAASHASSAVAQFLGRAAKTPQAIVLGTKALAQAAFSPPPPRSSAAPGKVTGPAAKHDLETHYRRVTDEIRSLTAYDETGTPRMRPEARRALGARFDAVRAVSPPLADRMETVAARRVEYLAGIIPKLPDYGTVQIGPDRRRTPELQMRTFARAVAVLEDPRALLSRAAHGRVTPGEAAAFRAGYPEMLADYTHQIVTELPTLQRTLPRKQRLALSILTGVPVDPAMTPSILRVIQGMYASEPGTQGGTQAPTPQPQFGSVKRSDPGTAAQRRQGLTP